MTASHLIADFYAGSKTRAAVLDIAKLDNGRREHVQSFTVTDKRHARQLAADIGALPWNF